MMQQRSTTHAIPNSRCVKEHKQNLATLVVPVQAVPTTENSCSIYELSPPTHTVSTHTKHSSSSALDNTLYGHRSLSNMPRFRLIHNQKHIRDESAFAHPNNAEKLRPNEFRETDSSVHTKYIII